jgi:hypothetical protein
MWDGARSSLFGRNQFTGKFLFGPKTFTGKIIYLAKNNSQASFARVNTNMTNENKKLLINLLEEFFYDYDINARDFLCNNDVAKCLKKNLSEKNRWRNLPRGKPIDSKNRKENPNKKKEPECPF